MRQIRKIFDFVTFKLSGLIVLVFGVRQTTTESFERSGDLCFDRSDYRQTLVLMALILNKKGNYSLALDYLKRLGDKEPITAVPIVWQN